MSIKQLQQNIPSGWQATTLGKVSSINNGSTNTQDATADGEYPLFDRSVEIKKSNKYLFDDTAIILPGEGAEFIPKIYSGKFDLHQRAYAIFPDKNIVSPAYLYHFLYANRRDFVKSSVGSTVKSLRLPFIQSINVKFPPITEQQKISEILGAVDGDIAKTQEMIEVTEKLKRGLMKQLFTRGIGYTKFKETIIGQIPEEWEVGELGSYLLRNPDYGINAAGVDYTEELPTYIRITDISGDGKFISENKKSVDHKDSGNYLLQAGDLLFVRTGASVGKTYLYNPDDGKLVFAGFLIRVRTNEEKLLAKYLSYFVQTPIYWKWVRVMSTRSGQPGINGNEYAGMVIPVPTPVEQKKYTEILSAVDEKISINKKIKEKLTLLKRGLMQDLLSGTVRTNI